MAWPECHALLGESDNLLAKLLAFNFDSLTFEKVTIVEQLLHSDVFTVDNIKSEHGTAAALLQWINSLLTLYKSKAALSSVSQK